MGGDGAREQITADHRCRRPHAGDGPTHDPSGGAGPGRRVCAVVPHRRLQRIHNPYGQNITTRFLTGGYGPLNVHTSACLPLHYHRYSPATWTINVAGER